MIRRLRYVMALWLALLMLAGCSSGGLPDAPALSATSVPTEPPQPRATSTTRPRATSTPNGPKATPTKGKVPSQPTRQPTKTATTVVEEDTPTPEDIFPTEPPIIDETPTFSLPDQSPTAAPTPLAKDFDFLDQSDYTDQNGNAVIVGLIQYKGDIAIGNVEIAVELEDKDHALLSTESAESVPSLVQPGGYIPFRAVFINPPDNFEFYNTTIQGDDVDQDMLALYTDRFEFLQVSLIQSTDPAEPKLVGKVKNVGPISAEYTEVVAALLDDSGNVLDVNSAFTTLNSIAIGKQSAFDIKFQHGKGGTKYKIVATALAGN